MGTRQRKAFSDKYRAAFLSLIALLFVSVSYGQTFQPGQHIVINDALGPANATPTDSRSMFYDVNFFLYRDYNGPTEVLTYLNLSKYRTGGFPIMVHSGGSLSGGVWTGGIRLVYWFKNGTADSNLVRWYTDSSSAACTGCLLAANNLSDLTNANTARANLGLGAMALLGTTAGGDLSGTFPNPTVSRLNGQLASYYLNYLNLVNTPAIPAQLNPTGLGLVTITGTYPNLTWTGRTPGIEETIFANNATSRTDSLNIGAFLFRFFGTSALGIPSGTTAQRPSSPAQGDTRWNTDSLALESWNGSAWVHPTGGGGGGGGITALTGDGTASGTGTVPFTLATVNSNVFGSNTFLKFGVNGKGLVTSATAVGSGDIISALGFTPYNATNPSGYISLSSLSANLPIVYNSGTGNISLSTPNTVNKYLNGYGSFVTLNTDSITEGATNLFFTNARARSAISGTSPITYNSGTGAIGIQVANTSQNGYLSSTDWNTFNGKLTSTLTSGNIFVGNGSNVATSVTPSGAWTITNAGVSTLTANSVATSNIQNNAVTLAKQATNTANYIQGWDGSGNPTALAPDTLFVLNRVSGTGVQVGNIYSDTLYLNNLVAGTNVSLTKNADSSITINSTGGGLATNNADSIRHLFVDTTGMYNGDLPYYNVLSNTYKFKQSNDKEGYLGILYQKATPVAADFAVFGTASLATVGGKLQISGGSGFGSGANLTAYGITRLARWKIQYRIINITPGNGNGAGINSTNAWASNAFSVLGRVDLRTAGGSQTILNGGNNPASLSLLTTGNSAANGAANDTTLITVERILDSVKVVAYNRTKNAYSSAVYGYNIYSGGINMANTGYFAIFSFGGTQQIDSLTISTTEIKNAQAAYIGDSKCIGYLDSVYSYAIGPKTDAYIPTTISWSEGSDRTTEVLTALHELWLLSPKQVFLEIGSNDPRSGLSNATYQANFTAIYDSCIVHGIRPIVLLPFFETAQDLSGQVTFLQSSFPASRVIDTWTPIKSNPTRFLTNGAADGIHPNYNGTDTLVQTIVKAYAYQGGTNSVNAYIKNNPSTQQLGANFNIQGSGTMFGGTVLGGTTFGTNRFLINGKTSTNNNFFLYENSSTGMEFGNYIDGGTAGAKSTWTGSAMLIGKRQGSATTEIARWDTSGAGHYFMGRTTDDGTGAPMQLYTSNFGVLSLSSSSASGAYISLSNTGTGVIGYFGTGSIATGANINDFSIRSQVTGKLWFAKNGGTAMGLLDNGNLNLGSSFTSNASALVNLTSTTQGFLFPRMTLAQFTAISSKATSLHAVLTDSSGRLALYDGTKIVTYATTDMLGSTNIYNSDGTATGNRTYSGGNFSLSLGTSGSPISTLTQRANNITLWPIAGVGGELKMFGTVEYGNAGTTVDANYTTTDARDFFLGGNITATRTVNIPLPSNSGISGVDLGVYIQNATASSNKWIPSSAFYISPYDSITSLATGASYNITSDGTRWNLKSTSPGIGLVIESSAGTLTLATATDYVFNGSTSTWTLPSLNANQGRKYYIKNAGSGNLIVQRGGSDNIYDTGSVTSLTVSAGQSVVLIAGPSFWYKEN